MINNRNTDFSPKVWSWVNLTRGHYKGLTSPFDKNYIHVSTETVYHNQWISVSNYVTMMSILDGLNIINYNEPGYWIRYYNTDVEKWYLITEY